MKGRSMSVNDSMVFARRFIAAAAAAAAGAGVLVVGQPARGEVLTVDFEDVSLGDAAYLDGSYTDQALDDPAPQGGGSGRSRAVPFVSRGTSFANWYDRDWFAWTGFAITSVNNPIPSSPVYENQYSAAAGPAFAGTRYAIAYQSSYGLAPVIELPLGYDAASIRVTNTTYTSAVIRAGSAPYARQFGNDPATPGGETSYPDVFSVTFTGYAGGNATGSVLGSVEFLLADYRFADDSQDFIVDDWREVNLSALAGARSIGLSWFSTDTSTYDGITYINTPTYLALDNLSLVAVPEPGTWALAGAAAAGVAWRRYRGRRPLTQGEALATRVPPA
jgi:hypothetical protein